MQTSGPLLTRVFCVWRSKPATARWSNNAAEVRILPDALTSVHQAMVLPDGDDPRIAALDAFVARALACGFVSAQGG